MANPLAFPSGVNIMISGQTQSGKTFFTANLLKNCDRVFKHPPTCILYYYKHYQDLYRELEDALGQRIRFKDKLPSEEELVHELAEIREQHKSEKCHFVVCADDWMDQIYKNKLFLDLVTRLAHHENISNIFLVQEGSITGAFKRDLLNNLHGNIYMANCRDRSSLRQLAILLSDYKCIMEAYDYCCKGGRGSYLMIMTHPEFDQALKYSTKILDPEGPIIFQSRKQMN